MSAQTSLTLCVEIMVEYQGLAWYRSCLVSWKASVMMVLKYSPWFYHLVRVLWTQSFMWSAGHFTRSCRPPGAMDSSLVPCGESSHSYEEATWLSTFSFLPSDSNAKDYPGSVQGQDGCGFSWTCWVGGNPARGRGAGTRRSLGSLQTQTTLWLCISNQWPNPISCFLISKRISLNAKNNLLIRLMRAH